MNRTSRYIINVIDTFKHDQKCDLADPLGACVSFFGGCLNNIAKSECSSSDTYYKGQTCNSVDPYGACIFADTCNYTRRSKCHSTYKAGNTCS